MPYTPGIETLSPAFPDRSIPFIAYGGPFDTLTASHIVHTLNATRVYIICSTSLAQNAHFKALPRLTAAIEHAGATVVGTRTGFRPHTHWDEVVGCAADVAKCGNVDCIVTLGAGSLTDAAKVVCWMLANEVVTGEELEGLRSDVIQTRNQEMGEKGRKEWKPPKIRQVAIPTSLSGGEYQRIAGVTLDDGSERKVLFEPPEFNPSLVVLDPELTVSTPEAIWLSTGIRAVDHCVETLCSLRSNEKGDESAKEGLRKLVPGLLRCKRDRRDLDARFECMIGVKDAMHAVTTGVPMGGSHAIGHQLGPLGVGHGETSCIMLPAVCKWNRKENANRERQKICLDVLLEDRVTREAVQRRFGEGKDVDLGDVLDVVIRDLGLPRTLKEVGVGRDRLEGLAKNSLQDHWIGTNPKPITREEEVLEILHMVVD